MARHLYFLALIVDLGAWISCDAVNATSTCYPCEVQVTTEAGTACGLRKRSSSDAEYASFLAMPYAKQPVGERRFKELQKLEPWSNIYYATKPGPVCPQHDLVYKELMSNKEMDEACIHANVHIPIEALPPCKTRRSRDIKQPYQTAWKQDQPDKSGLPILVFVHGGGFSYGSGDTDLYGPEYLVSEGIIVITFNYRLGVFGFLSLDSEVVPGNAGLRDMVTLLRWVQDNADHFGGDKTRVTLAGHSAGAAAVHLLTLSKETRGLFQRVILMSGVGIRSFFTTSPSYAAMLKRMFLNHTNVTFSDAQTLHDELIKMPLDKIQAANKKVLDFTGLVGFAPVVEPEHSGLTILDKDPELLIDEGRADDIPTLVGMTNSECEVFRTRYEECKVFEIIKHYKPAVLSPTVVFANTEKDREVIAEKVEQQYLGDSTDMNSFVRLSTDSYFKYPAMKLAQMMAKRHAKLYLYQFFYEPTRSMIKEALKLKYAGASHIEDLTFVFRTNSVRNEEVMSEQDSKIRAYMTNMVVQFTKKGNPNQDKSGHWSPTSDGKLKYQAIDNSKFPSMKDLSEEEAQMMRFFESVFEKKEDFLAVKR